MLGVLWGEIAFDAVVADTLIASARSAADTLRGQSGARRSSAEDALAEFRGAYARVFEDACRVEAEDRALLAGTLEELA